MNLTSLNRKLFFTITLVLSLFMFSGCNIHKNDKISTKNQLEELNLDNFEKSNKFNIDNLNYYKHTDKITIGFAMDSLKEERWKKDKEFFINKAKELNAEARVTEANGDIALQISQVNQLITEGVNILVIVPVNEIYLAGVVEEAHKAGIKVISYDRLINNSDLDYYISFDNEKVGQIQAKAMLDKIHNGNLAYVGGADTDNNAKLFRKGTMDALKDKNVSLLMDKYSPDWKADEAYKNVKEMLNSNKDKIQGIICANDGTATGAIKALSEAGLNGIIPVTGQDADLNACQRIVSGEQLMTVYKPVKAIAEKAVEVAIDVASNKSISTNSTVDNGYKQVKSCLLDPIEVNKNNINDTVIKDNWQKSDDIYKNVNK